MYWMLNQPHIEVFNNNGGVCNEKSFFIEQDHIQSVFVFNFLY